MKEGYYWIQHVGIVQVAYYTNDTVDDLETGKTITGVWHLTRGDDICHNGEAEVLEGPLSTIVNNCTYFEAAAWRPFHFRLTGIIRYVLC